jgi:hypothetical protein
MKANKIGKKLKLQIFGGGIASSQTYKKRGKTSID